MVFVIIQAFEDLATQKEAFGVRAYLLYHW